MFQYLKTQIGKSALSADGRGASMGRGSADGRGAGVHGASGGRDRQTAGAAASAGTRTTRQRTRQRTAIVALAGVLAMLASVLALVAPTANPAQAQADTHYGEIFVRIWNFNKPGINEQSGGLTQDSNRVIPAGVTMRYRITPRAQGDSRGTYPASGCTDAAVYSQVTGIETRIEEGDHDGVFVRRPGGASNDCVYDVEFLPSSHTTSGVTSWYGCHLTGVIIPQDTVIDGTIDPPSGRDRIQTSCEKIISFVPEIDLDLPDPVEIPGRTDTSIQATRINVGVARASTSSERCGGQVSVVVNNDGTLAYPETGLWEQPAGERSGSCGEYTLTFPETDSVGNKLVKVAGTSEDTEVSDADKVASSAYERPQKIFNLDTIIEGLPQGTPGTTYDVEFTAVGTGCSNLSSETLTWNSGESRFKAFEDSVIDYPRGAQIAADICAYNITWPEVAGYQLDTDNTDTQARKGNEMVTATYEVPPGTTFTPDITIQVPNYPADDDAVLHYYETIQFRVEFARSSGPATGCSDFTGNNAYIYEVAGNTNAGVAQPEGGSPPTLTDVPHGEDDSCVYTATFQSQITGTSSTGQSYTLSLVDSATTMTATVDNSNPPTSHQLSREYQAGNIEFSRGFSAVLPTVMSGGSSLYAAANIDVGFEAREGSPANCSTTTATLTVPNDGTIAPVDVDLIDRPAGETQRCIYDVAFEEQVSSASGAATTWRLKLDEVLPELMSPYAPGTVQAQRDESLGARYAQVFAPPITVRVPQVSDAGTTDNAYAGAKLTATVARAGGPTSGCSSGDAVWTVQTNGSATTDFDFIEYPAAANTRCSYTITFPANDTPANAGDAARLTLTGTAAHTVAYDTADFEVGYYSVFSPRYVGGDANEIWVPFVDPANNGDNLLAGATFTVEYAPVSGQNAACVATPTTQNYEVGIGGTHSLGGDATVMSGEDLVSLVDVPAGQTTRCRYTANFADSFDKMHSGSTNTYHLVTQDNLEISGATGDIFAAYGTGTVFKADVSISVPPRKTLDANGMETDQSAFYDANSGTRTFFRVSIARSSGPASGCSSLDDQKFGIQADGTVEQTSGGIFLIDQPRGQTGNCAYTVTFPGSLMSHSSVMPPWTLNRDQSVAVAALTAANPSVAASYFEDASNFLPLVNTALPAGRDGLAPAGGTAANLFAGVAFTVRFAPVSGSHRDCSPAVSYTYTVDNSGTFQSNPDLEALVDVPLMQTTRCSYTATVTPASVNSPSSSPLSWQLDLGSAASQSVSGGSRAVTVSYALAGDVTFDLVPDVTVPQYNSDDNPASHAFAGEQIRVTLTKDTGPATGCTADATTITWTIGANGSLTTSDSLTVVDYPQAESTRCVYSLAWSTSEVGAGTPAKLDLQTGASAGVSAGDRDLMAQYHAPESDFEPAVSGSVELVDEDGDQVHDLSGVTVEVGYAPVDGSDNGCSSADSEVYAIGDDGTLSLDASSSAVTLVDRPSGVDARCVYALTYPEAVVGEVAPDAPAGTEPVSVPVARGTLTQLTAADPLVLNYAMPPRPAARVDPVPLMSANRGVERLPLRVVMNVPSGAFILGDAFEVLVWVPGACGTDTFLFGGVPASAGVAYAVPAVGSASQVVVVGEGASLINRQASYSLPPYVDAPGSSAADSSGREACAVRVSVLSAPPGCSLIGAVGVDGHERSYVEAVWSQGSAGFNLTASFDCSDAVTQAAQGNITLAQGWVTLPFNGATGTSPEAFARELSGAVSSLWVWNTGLQSWLGWTARHGEVGLSRLTQGETVMAYVHSDVTITYSPDDLLEPRGAGGSLSLEPRYSLHTFGGNAPARVSSLVRQPSSVAVVFLWHSETQSWRYNLPGRRPIASLDIVWFDTLNPGDTVFIYNQSSQPTTIGWG